MLDMQISSISFYLLLSSSTFFYLLLSSSIFYYILLYLVSLIKERAEAFYSPPSEGLGEVPFLFIAKS
ncbi:MAG: hypothetical protein IKB96_03220, partial [Prevotella sp.]|nr:hypothetical protein [Prevotella sp.]